MFGAASVIGLSVGGSTRMSVGTTAIGFGPITSFTFGNTAAGNVGFEIGRTDGTSSTPFMDFHCGATAVDYDVRLIASAGTGVAGGGTLTITGGTTTTSGILDSSNTTGSTSSSTGALTLDGGIGISLTTDASSSTNGGTITTAGGLAVAKKAYIGTDLSIAGASTTNTNQTNTDANEATASTSLTYRYTLNSTVGSTSVLASGKYPGQIMNFRLVAITAGTILTITGTGFTSLVLDAVGDYYALIWDGTSWSGIGGNLAGASAAFNA